MSTAHPSAACERGWPWAWLCAKCLINDHTRPPHRCIKPGHLGRPRGKSCRTFLSLNSNFYKLPWCDWLFSASRASRLWTHQGPTTSSLRQPHPGQIWHSPLDRGEAGPACWLGSPREAAVATRGHLFLIYGHPTPYQPTLFLSTSAWGPHCEYTGALFLLSPSRRESGPVYAVTPTSHQRNQGRGTGRESSDFSSKLQNN